MANSKSFSVRNVIYVGLCTVSTMGMGCVVDSTGDDFEADDEQTAVTEQAIDPTTNNDLPYKCFQSHKVQATTRDLGAMQNGITYRTNNTLPSMPKLPAPNETGTLAGCRRAYLKKLFECALPLGEYVKDPGDLVLNFATGTYVPYSYYGQIGLASGWKTNALTTDEKQWLTACVMARTNRFGVTIAIDLAGANNTMLEPGAAEAAAAGYAYAESRVWGNMFDSQTALNLNQDPAIVAPAFEGHVCQLYDTAVSLDAAYRVCDSQDCGFVKHGECNDLVNFQCSLPPIARPAYCTGKKIDVYLQQASLVAPQLTTATYAPQITPYF